MRTLACTFIAAAFAAAAPAVHAAASAAPVTPANTSVVTGQSQVLTAVFRTTAGAPSPGETVTFQNDNCGLFANGQSTQQMVTAADGTASVTFTAGLETGRTCIVRASAGAQTEFSVITYTLDRVVIMIEVTASPAPPLPGRAFTIEAFVKLDTIELPNVTLAISSINGTARGAADSPGGSTRAGTRLQFNVFPESGTGDFEIEIDFQGKKRRFPIVAGAIAGLTQDMWWGGGAENGWGMSVIEHGETLFIVLYVYGDDGRPTWYVMSGGTWDATHRIYTGALYHPRGSPFYAYDASRFVPGVPAGNATITFSDASNAILDYQIGSAVGTKAISRQPFGPAVLNGMRNRGEMMWGGITQNGWGVAALQQYDTFFTVWFTYDDNGLPTWFVLPGGTWVTPTSYEGRLYSTTGSQWVGQRYRANQLVVTDRGPFRLRFNDAGPIALDWTVGTRTGTLQLQRQGF